MFDWQRGARRVNDAITSIRLQVVLLRGRRRRRQTAAIDETLFIVITRHIKMPTGPALLPQPIISPNVACVATGMRSLSVGVRHRTCKRGHTSNWRKTSSGMCHRLEIFEEIRPCNPIVSDSQMKTDGSKKTKKMSSISIIIIIIFNAVICSANSVYTLR